MSVTIDVSDALRGLNILIQGIKTGMGKTQGEIALLLERDARRQHRFKQKTGALQEATIGDVLDNASVVELYIDSARASYGEYVHEGARGRAPDPYVYEAMARNKNNIQQMYEKLYEDAIVNANL